MSSATIVSIYLEQYKYLNITFIKTFINNLEWSNYFQKTKMMENKIENSEYLLKGRCKFLGDENKIVFDKYRTHHSITAQQFFPGKFDELSRGYYFSINSEEKTANIIIESPILVYNHDEKIPIEYEVYEDYYEAILKSTRNSLELIDKLNHKEGYFKKANIYFEGRGIHKTRKIDIGNLEQTLDKLYANLRTFDEMRQ